MESPIEQLHDVVTGEQDVRLTTLEQVHDAVMSTRAKVSKEKAKEGPTW